MAAYGNQRCHKRQHTCVSVTEVKTDGSAAQGLTNRTLECIPHYLIYNTFQKDGHSFGLHPERSVSPWS